MGTYLSKDGTYLINDVKRGRKLFRPIDYFTLDNWWYEFKMKSLGREPSCPEMQQMCARRGIAGWIEGKGTTFPGDSMRGIHSRLCKTTDPILLACGFVSGRCAPMHHYRDYFIFYLSNAGDKTLKGKIKKAIAEKKALNL